ncbi:hypothetical protein [Acetivibrio mesophilus]|uniref:hypothetical protein n=1 Tax=Acetivibrio mesophilus TaxID=2487273 RepID=UPI00086A211E|nr:hypothetical protein [Acetivibrio mesophilus]ODM26307.1 hypothetical protein A7W90_08760 [Clostridium sp. Bc-iso-3]HHV30359.1 hypothetical protein [Clostridium sp.]
MDTKTLGVKGLLKVNWECCSVYESLERIEKRMCLQMSLNKRIYLCLEEAFKWLNMSAETYSKIHAEYITLLSNQNASKVTKTYPLATTMLLIYTAVYRYNDDDSNGFWPEFFGGEKNYNYQRDVNPVMNALKIVKERYDIDTNKRQYMQKSNLSEIFSQIYLPEVSLKRIFSALYSFCFRGYRGNDLYNVTEFLEFNEYRLDKPGCFFIKEDDIIEDSYDKIVELMKSGLDNAGEPDSQIELPNRFFDTFREWYQNDKKQIDNKKEEFYIGSPKVKIDMANDKIMLKLPKQKSRTYIDENCGWKVIINGDSRYIPARIIRQSGGTYLILDEDMELIEFRKIEVEYIFNDKVSGKWTFLNEKDYVLFDKNNLLLQRDTVKRDGCIVALKKNIIFPYEENIIEKFEISDWKEYLFYEVSLEDYPNSKMYLDTQAIIDIEDRPVIQRKAYKLLFEEKGNFLAEESLNVYESFGVIQFRAPYIQEKYFEIRLSDLGCKRQYEIKTNLEKLNDNTLSLNLDHLLKKGIYNLSIKYKDKSIYREVFLTYKDLNITNEYKMSYSQKDNMHRRILISKNNEIEISANHYETKLYEDCDKYIIEPTGTAVARFIFKLFNWEVHINKIVKPIRIEITGLEEVINQKSDGKLIDITKTVFCSKDIRIQISNFDYRYEYLAYQLCVVNINDDNSFTDTRKVKFGDEYTWRLKSYVDRLINFDNMLIVLNISNSTDEILYSQKLIKVTQKIDMLGFKKTENENHMLLCWKESQRNTNRIIRLYNYTVPSDKPLEFDLEDDSTEINIDLRKCKFGAYVPIVDYKREVSFFDNAITEKKFFDISQINNSIINKLGPKGSKQEHIFCRIIWCVLKEKDDEIIELTKRIDFKTICLYELFCAMLQIKYFIDLEKRENIDKLICINKEIIKGLLQFHNLNQIIEEICSYKEEFNTEDISYLITLFLSIRRAKSLSDNVIELLSEVDLINALCLVENGRGELPNNLITACKASFDSELLGMARDFKSIYSIIETEVNIIKNFWEWLTEHKNNYLLKRNYTKARMFRIYEYESEISSYKVLGHTIDDLVDSIIDENSFIYPKVPETWSDTMNINQEIFREFSYLMQKEISYSYKEVIKAAFLVVSQLNTISDSKYFELMIKCYFGKRRDMFNRYRAYFKLIFI